jgi:hypothetical protein
MPPGVKFNGHNYKIRSKLAGGKQIALCPGSATRAQVWAAYELLCTDSILTLDKLCKQYLNSHQFKKKAPGTQHLYLARHKSLGEITFNQGKRFLDLPPDQVTPGTLQQIMDLRETEGAPVNGNREIKGFLSAVYSWALSRDMVPGLVSNPCHAVQRNEEKAREHYVEDWEFALAVKHAPVWLANVLELAYLLYARVNEVLILTRQNILHEGVLVKRSKGSKDNIFEWSP